MDKEKIYDLFFRSALVVFIPFLVIAFILAAYIYNDFAGER